MTFATPFGKRVAGVFATRVARVVIGMATSFLLAGMLLPEGRGQYAVLVLVPGMLNALGQFGLPSAMSFFAGRGRSVRDLQRLGWLLTAGLSVVLVGATLLALPWLQQTLLRPVPMELLLVSLASVPFQFGTAFAGSTLIGKQRLRNYNLIVVAQSALMLIGVVVMVGLLDFGVEGALLSYVAVAVIAAIGTAVELGRAVADEPEEGGRVKLSQIAGYGIRIYPASVSGYFSYRVDVLILSAILGASGAASIGLYTFAVSLAEMVFMIPDSVSTVFYPRVAGMERREADRLAPQVSRFTVLVTLIGVLGLLPAAWVVTSFVLPAYAGSLLPFAVLLPGIVALSVSKVVSGYISGLGLPLAVARASIANLVINVIANLVLVPAVGIVGAALASLISYAGHASILVFTAARLAHTRPLDYVIPTGAEVSRLRDGVTALLRGRRLRGAG
ncbi:MAG TPA: polysaccharide biosynthesis C-terminal domain-containing protein [Candidatus Limnocylindria bacterium]|nr:polysaccharide biosynthesis C-terminal domain-containing protein [Candidatus Limnocylindria bacterium]